MSIQNGGPTRAAIYEGVDAAHAAEGYVKPDGSIDTTMIRERMFEVLRPRKVIGKRERETKAVTRGTMVEQLYPALPGPEAFTEQDDPQLVQAVWGEIDKFLWGLASTNATSMLQRLVGVNMGNGYVLCRTVVGKDRASAVYITDSPECIELDFVGPGNRKLDRTVRAVVADREMLIYRQPENARRYQRRFEGTLKQLTSAANGQLVLAVESATADGTGEPTEADAE